MAVVHSLTHTRISMPVRRSRVLILMGLLVVLCAPSLVGASDELIVYSGRAERLIKPVLDAFQAKTDITVRLLTGSSTQLINRLQAEGPRTQADIFLTNDAGTLERARELRLLKPVAINEVEHAIPQAFRAPDNSWIGLSGRIWVVVYNTSMMQPADVSSVLDLAKPQWKGNIAIPTAGSEYLQAGVSVIRAAQGDTVAESFLTGIRDNAKNFVYGKNRQIVSAVAKGQVALGLVNHYYIYRHLAKDPQAPIDLLMTDQAQDQMGLVMNATGVGIVAATRHLGAAKTLIRFLVSRTGQQMFAEHNKEYPLHPAVDAHAALPPRDSFRVAQIPLAQLAELREPTMTLIERAGLR